MKFDIQVREHDNDIFKLASNVHEELKKFEVELDLLNDDENYLSCFYISHYFHELSLEECLEKAEKMKSIARLLPEDKVKIYFEICNFEGKIFSLDHFLAIDYVISESLSDFAYQYMIDKEYIKKSIPASLKSNIDWEKVAVEMINNDEITAIENDGYWIIYK